MATPEEERIKLVTSIEKEIAVIRSTMPRRLTTSFWIGVLIAYIGAITGAIWWAADINANVHTLTVGVQEMQHSLEKLSEVVVLDERVAALQREVERLRRYHEKE